MAVLPWLGAIKEPTSFKEPDRNHDKAPKANLELEYCFGYRAKDCRNNLRYLADGKVVYNAAGLGVVLDPKKNT